MKLGTVKPKVKPEEGDYKIEKKFAWWPRVVENKRIWLEQYKVIHIYTIRKRISMIYGGPILKGVWGGWDFVTERLIKKHTYDRHKENPRSPWNDGRGDYKTDRCATVGE